METYGINDIYGNNDESSQPNMLHVHSCSFVILACKQKRNGTLVLKT